MAIYTKYLIYIYIYIYIMDKMWQYYGLLGTLIVGYSMVASPKGNTLKYLWVSYLILAAILGVMYN